MLFQSPVLQGVRFEEAGARALAAINLRNCSLLVGRLSYYEEDGVIALEYAILASNLQTQEFIRALQIVAAYADTLDDDLLLELGVGARARDVWGPAGDAGGGLTSAGGEAGLTGRRIGADQLPPARRAGAPW